MDLNRLSLLSRAKVSFENLIDPEEKKKFWTIEINKPHITIDEEEFLFDFTSAEILFN